MGIHLDANLLYEIDRLPVDHKLELITYLTGKVREVVVKEVATKSRVNTLTSGGLVEDPVPEWLSANVKIVENPSGKPSWADEIDPPGPHLSPEDWKKRVNNVAGAWEDHLLSAEELIERIYSSRTITDREYLLDE